MASRCDADPVIFEEKQERIFARSRLFAGHESALKAHEFLDQRAVVALSEGGIEIDHGNLASEPECLATGLGSPAMMAVSLPPKI